MRMLSRLVLVLVCLPALTLADDVGFIDCHDRSEPTQVLRKAAKTSDIVASVPCSERFTILVKGEFFSRIQTKDGQVGYIQTYVISHDYAHTSVRDTTQAQTLAQAEAVPSERLKPQPALTAQPQPDVPTEARPSAANKAFVTDTPTFVWATTDKPKVVAELKRNAQVTVLSVGSDFSQVKTDDGTGYVRNHQLSPVIVPANDHTPDTQLSLANVKSAESQKKPSRWCPNGCWNEISSGLQQAATNMENQETNNVCADRGGLNSRRTVNVSTTGNGSANVYSSSGTRLGTVQGNYNGTSTARIAVCNDGTEHLY